MSQCQRVIFASGKIVKSLFIKLVEEMVMLIVVESTLEASVVVVVVEIVVVAVISKVDITVVSGKQHQN